jgi:hypothetical protein
MDKEFVDPPQWAGVGNPRQSRLDQGAKLVKPWIFAALIVFAIRAHAAEVDPATEAQIDRLVDASPYSESLRIAEASPHPEDLARLQALNPGRTDEVRHLLETQSRCEASVLLASTRDAMREVGRRLGRAKIELLIQFYSGPDYVALTAINERSDAGEAPSDADIATIDRIMRDYPLMEMAEIVTSLGLWTPGEPNLLERFERCLTDRNAGFERAGLRQASAETD